MTLPRDPKRLSASLMLGLALNLPVAAIAQTPGISSGSGSGTGTGTSAGSGLGTTGTGTSAGSGLGSTGTGSEAASGTGRNVLPRLGPDSYGARGPSNRTPQTLRDSDLGRPIPGTDVSREVIQAIDARLLGQARAIVDPADRSLSLERIARTKIFGSKLSEAHVALAEAGQAAQEIPPSTLKDRRMMSVIATELTLCESEVREGLQPDAGAGDSTTVPAPEGEADRTTWLTRASGEWDRAHQLAGLVGNPNYRGQLMSRVAESRAEGAKQMAVEAIRDRDAEAVSERPRTASPLAEQADRLFLHAADQAEGIDRPVWRDNALQTIASKAAVSGRYATGLQVARRVGRPEIRVEAFLRVAEGQAHHDLQQDATASYQEAARAVASMSSDDPRMVLAGILIDSLISSGRFEDARASVGFIVRPSRRLQALGAIAESQGRRGLADAALAWIERDVAPDQRPLLRRRVTDGMLATVEQYRTSVQAAEKAR